MYGPVPGGYPVPAVFRPTISTISASPVVGPISTGVSPALVARGQSATVSALMRRTRLISLAPLISAITTSSSLNSSFLRTGHMSPFAEPIFPTEAPCGDGRPCLGVDERLPSPGVRERRVARAFRRGGAGCPYPGEVSEVALRRAGERRNGGIL